jgi:hypothetical protein
MPARATNFVVNKSYSWFGEFHANWQWFARELHIDMWEHQLITASSFSLAVRMNVNNAAAQTLCYVPTVYRVSLSRSACTGNRAVLVRTVAGFSPCEDCRRVQSLWGLSPVSVLVRTVAGFSPCEDCRRVQSLWGLSPVSVLVRTVAGFSPCEDCRRVQSFWGLSPVSVLVRTVAGLSPCEDCRRLKPSNPAFRCLGLFFCIYRDVSVFRFA